MNMRNGKTGFTLLIVAAALLALTGCPSPNGETEPGTEATLSSINVASVAVTSVPEPIAAAEWDAVDFNMSTLPAVKTGYVFLTTSAALADAEVTVSSSSGATIVYGKNFGDDKPESFSYAQNEPMSFTNGEYLYIQVTSGDRQTVNYYRVQIQVLSNSTLLTQIAIAGTDAADTGIPGSAWDATGIITGYIGLSDGQKANAQVEVSKVNTAQAVKFARVSGPGAPAFGDTDTFTFADGDFLYIEVIAENQIDKAVYKLEIGVGRTATLSGITFGTTPVQVTGIPTETLVVALTAEAGYILFQTPQPSGGYTVTATPDDNEATVKYGHAVAGSTPAFSAANTIIFVDGEFLYVEVTAANTTTKRYYKVQVNFRQTATLNYGKPAITNGVIDPIWNTVTETYAIKKIYKGDSGNADFIANPDTSGVAKALWDENGVYVYVQVTDPTPMTAAATNEYHTNDSVEVFINENYNSVWGGYGNTGGQYRIGTFGELSGDPAAATDALTTLNKKSAWTTASGYIVIFQVPWRFKSQYPLVEDKKFGFELQINACSADHVRDGVVVWNNIAHSNYQNVSDYGEATLKGTENLKVNAENPQITTQPASDFYLAGTTSFKTLTVTASVARGNLTYQWYSNTTNSNEGGTPIGSATTFSYVPPITTPGIYYYYVVVTNTDTDPEVNGDTTAVTASSVAAITLSSATEYIEKITVQNGAFAIYKFELPAGSSFGDYTKITAEFYVSTTMYARNMRARALGNYLPSDFGSNGNISYGSGTTDKNGPYIINNKQGGDGPLSGIGITAAKTWTSVDFPLTGSRHASYVAANCPAATATGPFYFAVGLSKGGAGDPVTYYVKKVTLSSADGSKSVVSFGCGYNPGVVGYGDTADREIIGNWSAEEAAIE
jgi:hypothetical protein